MLNLCFISQFYLIFYALLYFVFSHQFKSIGSGCPSFKSKFIDHKKQTKNKQPSFCDYTYRKANNQQAIQMRTNQFKDPFKEVSNLVNNPFAQAGLQHASSMIGQKLKIDGIMGKIFNPEIREYFNVDSTTVKNKLMKILFPFKEYEFEQQIKKLDLYIPIVSFMTLIMFSTIVKGILSQDFEPNLFRKTIWILIFTFAEVILAKGTENSISNLNIGTLELCSLVSYRFVSLSLVVVVLVITNMSIPYLHFVGIIYVFLVDTYYVKLQLHNYAQQKLAEEGLGSKIAILVHIVVTLAIIWLSDLI